MQRRLLLLALAVSSVVAFNPAALQQKAWWLKPHEALKKAVLFGGIAAATVAPIPALATIDDAALKVADTSYPIISKLQKKEVVPVLSKAIGVALTGDPISVLKVVKSADEALISTDPAKLVAALKAVDVALDNALKSNGVIPPLSDVEEVAKAAAAALKTTDKAKIKDTFSALVASANSADKFAVIGILTDGSKLASKINPADATAATAAVLDLLKEIGAQ